MANNNSNLTSNVPAANPDQNQQTTRKKTPVDKKIDGPNRPAE